MAQIICLAVGKREQTKLANRVAILDAAREVFSEMGFEAATVRDIIRRTGLSVGAFYNYFRSKEEVFDALADDGARRFRPILHALSDQAADFETYLKAAVRAYFDFIAKEHESSIRRAGGESAGASTLPHVRGTPEMLAVFEEVRTVFSAILGRGLGARVDLEFFTAACIAVAREIGDRMLERSPMDVDGATEFVVRLILGGLPALETDEPLR